ncbi:MAG: hypothetical protein ACP5E5_09230 [Acidobacteriaceae bacterium]
MNAAGIGVEQGGAGSGERLNLQKGIDEVEAAVGVSGLVCSLGGRHRAVADWLLQTRICRAPVEAASTGLSS